MMDEKQRRLARTAHAIFTDLKNRGFPVAVQSKNEDDPVLRQVNILQLYGSFQALEERFNTTFQNGKCFANEIPGLSEADREKIVEGFNLAVNWLALRVSAAELAEQALEKEGLRYDAKMKMAVRITGSRGRPEALIGRIAWRLYSEKYRGEGNTKSLREKIAEHLALYLDDRFLDPGSKGLIAKAIKNHENSERV